MSDRDVFVLPPFCPLAAILAGLHDGRSYTPRPQRLGEIPEDQLQISFTR